MNPPLTCGDCRHYLTDHSTFGTCKRYQPTVLAEGRQALPHTGPDDWCGEAQAQEAPAGQGFVG